MSVIHNQYGVSNNGFYHGWVRYETFLKELGEGSTNYIADAYDEKENKYINDRKLGQTEAKELGKTMKANYLDQMKEINPYLRGYIPELDN